MELRNTNGDVIPLDKRFDIKKIKQYINQNRHSELDEYLSTIKGMPKHSHGGVDITLSNRGVIMRRGGKDIKAAHGLFIPGGEKPVKKSSDIGGMESKNIGVKDSTIMKGVGNTDYNTGVADYANPDGIMIGGPRFSGIDKNSDQTLINPSINLKNLITKDYTDKGDFSNAYSSARKDGEKEFMWNHKRYSTTQKHSPGSYVTERDDNFKGNILSPFTRGIIPIKGGLFGDNSEDSYHKLRELYGNHKLDIPIQVSKYSPTRNDNKNETYYSITTEKTAPFVVDLANHILKYKNNFDEGFKESIKKQYGDDWGSVYNRFKNSTKNTGVISKLEKYEDTYNVPRYYNPSGNYKHESLNGLGNYQVSFGKDNKGNYISYYDKWDTKSGLEFLGAAKPIKVYDRIYIKDYGDGQQKRMYYNKDELSKLNIKDKNFDTLALQRELSNRGYKLPKSTKKSGGFDGTLGDETKGALIDYQNKNKTE